jgi:hypothetical protein
VGVPEIAHFTLPERAYDLWLRGELEAALGLSEDNTTRVEIIGGEIVVSPGPFFNHALIITEIQKEFIRQEVLNPDFPWRSVQVVNFNLPRIGDGYIPDLMVLTAEDFDGAATANVRNVTAKQIGLVVEVTSESTAANDRKPGSRRRRPTKWNGYANEGLEFYLLVDRAPNKAAVTLFTEPDPGLGTYRSAQQWAFGETIVLPEPFGIEIPTKAWQPWEK